MTEVAFRAYRAWVMDLIPSASEYRHLLLLVPFLPIALRKPVLTLSRTQALPVDGSPIDHMTKHLYSTRINPLPYHNTLIQDLGLPMLFGDYFNAIAPYALKPIQSAILSLVLRIAPFPDDNEIKDLISETYEKELSASLTIYHPVRFDYEVIFSPDVRCRSLPFSPRLPSNYRVASSLYDAFCKAKQDIRGKTFWPDIGLKSVGSKVAASFWDSYTLCNQIWKESEDSIAVSCADLERLYAETGFEVPGPVEMRHAWKYNDLKPRVYFARGGSTYFASKYIQSFFNFVIDYLPECHRRDRFTEPENSSLDPMDSSIIYDYASFTSTMDEIKNFIHALSIFFAGVEITVIDSRFGPVSRDLGEILQEYNAVCNDHPEFDASSYMPELSELYHTCGMLGVPGNIFSCTILHAIHIRFIAGLGNSKTVGDDGKVYLSMGEHPEYEKEHLWYLLESLGHIQWSKMFEFEWYEAEDYESVAKRTYNFVKRPYYRIENQMHSGKLLTLPNPVGIIGLVDDHHSFFLRDDADMIRVYRRQLDALIDSIPYELVELSEEDISLLYHVNRATQKAFVRKFAKRRYNEDQQKDRLNRLSRQICPNLPNSVNDYRSERVKLQQYDLDEPITVRVPFGELLIEGRDIGCVLEVPPSSCLGWLTKMKFVEVEDVTMTVTREKYTDDLVAEFLRLEYLPLKRAIVVRQFPQWCYRYLLEAQNTT